MSFATKAVRVVSAYVALAPFLAAAEEFAGDELVATTALELATAIETRRAEFEADPFAIYALVDTLLRPRFDMERASRGILAQHWKTTLPEEHARFREAFYNYLVASYGKLLLHFKRDTLRVLPFDDDVTTPPVRVKTILTMNDGTEVDVQFSMVRVGDEWEIVDVFAKGVSYVQLYRSQFKVDIATDGFDSVVDWLEGKGASRFPVSRPAPP
jgi:phospholipid transport system substrate-binding protein